MLEGGSGRMMSMQGGHFEPVPLRDLLDPTTGRAQVRRVDINSTRYAIARRYMIRLRRDDFDDAHELARFAATAHMTLQQFRDQFEYLVASEPPPLRLHDEPAHAALAG
jgi:6-phosphofructokinase 1